MGHAKSVVKVIKDGRELERELLVDTGSTYTLVKEEDLRRIGVEPLEEITFTTIEGREIKRKIGRAEVEVMGRREHTILAFAQEADKEVLGVHALEGLRLEVDVLTGKLREARTVLAL